MLTIKSCAPKLSSKQLINFKLNSSIISRNFSNSKSSKNDVTEQVSLADLNAGHKGFFDYTWGRWISNDEHERNIRKTKFSIEGLLEILKENVDYLHKSPQNAQLQIKSIGPLHEGKHNKIYRVDLTDGRSYVLRIPYSIGLAEYRKRRIQSEVATMDFLTKKHQLLMPNVSAWNATTNNPLGIEFMLLDYVAGDTLMKHWNPADLDIKAKSASIKPVVDGLESILATTFNKYGSLYFTEDVASELQNDLPYDGEINPDYIDRWRIGETTESTFWKGRHSSIGEPFRGPYNSAKEYLQATANVQLAYIEDDLGTKFLTPQLKEQLLDAKQVFEWYSQILTPLFEDKSLEEKLFSPRLNDPDLNPINIIHRQDPQKTYFLDFENTAIRPLIVHGSPGFVKNRGPKVFNKKDIPNYEELPEPEKKTIDHFIAQTQNQFAFEFLLKSSKKLENVFFPAFAPNLKRRQEIVETALKVDSCSKEYMDLEYDILKLSQEWQFLNIEGSFPLDISDEKFTQEATKMDEWNKYVVEHPFTETKGWIPRELFEKLLGTGVLVKNVDTGNYELKDSIQSAL